MKHGKLTWKLGIAAIAALGLSVMPAHFNVPGIGVEQAFAAQKTATTFSVGNIKYTGAAITVDDLTVTLSDANGDIEDVSLAIKTESGDDLPDGATPIGNYKLVDAGDGTNTLDGDKTEATFKVEKLPLSGADLAFENEIEEYTDFSESLDDTALKEILGKVQLNGVDISADVTLSVATSSKNKNAGSKSIIVAANSANVSGSRTLPVTVPAKTVEGVTAVVTPVEFTGKKAAPKITVYDSGEELTENTDYTVTIADTAIATGASEAERKVTIEWKGIYAGADPIETSVMINKCTTAPTVTLSKSSADYDGGRSVAPTVTLKIGDNKVEGDYYNVSWIKVGDENETEINSDALIATGTYKLKIASNNFTDDALKNISNTFEIKGKSLEKATVTGVYNKIWGTSAAPKFEGLTVTLDGKELKASEDAEADIAVSYDYADDGKSGSLTISPADTIYGKAYTGTITKNFTIVEPNMKYANITLESDEVEYTGEVNKVAVKSVVLSASGLEDLTLDEGNYTPTYNSGADAADCIKVGTVTVTVSGEEPYTGSNTATYKITQADIKDFAVFSPDPVADQVYNNGEAIEPEVALIQKKDNAPINENNYTLSYSANKVVGAGTITATGKGNLTGTTSITFKITPVALPDLFVKAIDDQTYTGSAIEPKSLDVMVNETRKALVEGTDYTLSYKNNTEVGEATVVISGAGNYSDEAADAKEVKFNIVEAKIGEDAVVDTIAAQVYTGSAIKPVKVVQTVGSTKVELKEGTDYTVEYKDNTEVGTASYTVTGKGNYTGTATGTFAIGNDFSKATVAAIKAVTYTGKALKPAVTVTLGDATLKAGTDYEVTYSNNTNAGKATVTITPAGSYAGDAKTVNFTINKASVKAKVTKITASKTAVGAGKSITLKATLSPAKSDANQTVNTKVTWTSNKTAIAKVNKSTGKVTGVSAGKAKITVKAADGSKKSKTITVYGIASKNLKQTVNAGKTKNLSANDTIKSAKSSNTKVATVTYKGKKVVIKGVKKGTAKVTVTTKNGGKNVITVTVK